MRRIAVALGLICGLIFAAAAEGQQPAPPIVALPASAFTAIGPTETLFLPTPSPTASPSPRPTRRPAPQPTPIVVRVTPVSTKPPSLALRRSVSGTATWYCLLGQSACPWMASSGNYAAAGPALRAALGQKWRGKIVETCLRNRPARCETVKLIDWCACGGGHVIDLFADVMAQFVGADRYGRPLRGGFSVVVRW